MSRAQGWGGALGWEAGDAASTGMWALGPPLQRLHRWMPYASSRYIWAHFQVPGWGFRWLAFFALQGPIVVAEAALGALWSRRLQLRPLPAWAAVPLTNVLLVLVAGGWGVVSLCPGVGASVAGGDGWVGWGAAQAFDGWAAGVVGRQRMAA